MESSRSFNLFAALPLELRIQIWHQILQQRTRIIKIRLRNRSLMDGLLTRQQELDAKRPAETRPDTCKDEQYGVVVDGYQTMSKLFQVNEESRQIAMAFYRVHIPCWLIKGRSRHHNMTPGMLYFNPEMDFLYISNDTGQVLEFLHDLKTVYDPQGVGLLHLAIDRDGLSGTDGLCSIDSNSLSVSQDVSVHQSFAETLMQLRQVYFVKLSRLGRSVLGLLTSDPSSADYINSSLPVLPEALIFDRFPRDPRPIDQDLARAMLEPDPRQMIHDWRKLYLNVFGNGVVPKAEYKVLLALNPMYPQIYDRNDAQNWLHTDRQAWIEFLSMYSPPSALDDGKKLEGVNPTAFGFWLFDIQAFGVLPASMNDDSTPRSSPECNLQDHPPELCLTTLL